MLDNLYVKALLFQNKDTIAGIVSFDLIYVSKELVEKIEKELKKSNLNFGDNIIFCATHTHTGPFISELFGTKPDRDYIQLLIRKTVLAIKHAQRNLFPSQLFCGSLNNNPFAFNRRYYMKDGSVVTNPGKLNHDIVKPEGAVDREIGVLLIKQDGKPAGIITNIVNHADTIGGDMVSADWHGQMEKWIQPQMGYEIPVISLVGCSGNINHFDISDPRNQTSYDEAKRIGKGYAEIILDSLPNLNELPYVNISVSKAETLIHYRNVSEKELKEAKQILRQKVSGGERFPVRTRTQTGDLTSEELARGDSVVKRFFAQQLIDFSKKQGGKKEKFHLLCIKFGNQLAITSLPGEPFTEIGMAIKKASPFKKTFVVSLANGSCGYIPLRESFERGGYEILPTIGGGVDKNTAEILIRDSLNLLR